MTAFLAALVNGAILSALVTAAVWLAMRITPRRVLNAATRYVAWWAALAVTVLLPALYLPKASSPVVAQAALTVADTAEIPFSDGPGQPWGPPPLPAAAVAPRTTPVSPAATPEARPILLWPSFPIEIPASRWPPWVLAAGLSASVLMLIRLIASWVLLQRRKARAFDAPAPLGARADQWLALCGSTRRGVRLAGSTEIAIPAAVGPLRPAILIPARLLDKMDEDALDQIGLHEAAHLARRDDCALLVQRVLEALFAPHPVVRWIARRIDLEREIACDDFVLAVKGKSRTYAACLTRMVELSAGARPSPAAAAAGSHLARRIEMLLDKSRHIGTRPLRAHLAVIVAALVGMVWMAGRSPSLLAFEGPAGLPAPTALLAQLAAPLLLVQTEGPQAVTPPTAKPDELCSVKGKAVNQATGEPLRKVTVLFRSEDSRAIFRTATGETGEFEAVALDPGVYSVTATRTGFLYTQYGAQKPGQSGTPLTLSPGQRTTGVDFKMMPQSVITGRIVNRDGEPMVTYAVAAYQTRYLGGRRVLDTVTATRSNDLGEYRLSGLNPGRYYIFVEKAPQSESEAGQDRSAKLRQEDYVTTYYPGTTDLRGAAPMEVGPGETIQGINVTLAKTRVTRVGGRVLNQTGEPGIPISVSLNSAERPGFAGNTTRVGPQGEFEFRGVAPGSYSLVASVWIGPGHSYRALQPLEVRQDSVENLTVQLMKGYEIPGNVKVEGDGELDLRSLRVGLRTPWMTSMAYAVTAGTPDDRGDFRMTGASPDRYIVSVDNMPDGFYVKSARIGDVDALEQGVDLTRGGPGPLEVVLSGKAPGISGLVNDDKDKPVADATVALVPREAGRQGQQPFYRTAKTDQFGNFKMRNLTPGEYRLYSWAEVVSGAWVDAEFLRPLDSKGKPVTLGEGGSQKVELKVIPAER